MSECVGICQMDDNQEYCLGCGRSAAQIFGNEEETTSAPSAPPTPNASTSAEAPNPPTA